MTLERLKLRLEELMVQKEKAVCLVHAVDGALQETMNWIEEFEKEAAKPDPKNESEPTQ